MIQQTVCLSLIAMLAGPLATISYGQGGGLLNKATAGTQARAQQRAQAAAQQRVEARVQQRTQAQMQQRVQAQLQTRATNRISRGVRGVAQAAGGAGRQMQKRGNAAQLQGGAAASARTQAKLGGTRFSAETKVRVNGSGRLVVPGPALLGNGQVNVKYFDNVFGRFNPLRNASGEEATAAATAGMPTLRKQAAGRPSDTPRDAPAPESNEGPRQPPAGRGFAVIEGRFDLPKAVRLRRSEISAIRDHALETGNAQLLASADQLEGILERFLAAQAAAATQSRGAIAGAASAQGSANASAMGQARGKFGPAGTRVAELPPAATPETAPAADSNTPQPAPTEPTASE